MSRATLPSAGVMLGAAVALVSSVAQAADCSLNLMNPIYIAGSSAVKPFLAEIAKVLVTQSPPVTIVYSGQGSCTGVSAILDGTPPATPIWTAVVELASTVAAAALVAGAGWIAWSATPDRRRVRR